MEIEKLRDEYLRLFEDKKKIEHQYLILQEKTSKLNFIEKNYQESLLQIEMSSEKCKNMNQEIIELKERIKDIGNENIELNNLNNQYIEALKNIQTEAGHSTSKIITENSKIKTLENELSKANQKIIEMNNNLEEINKKYAKEQNERSFIEKQYEDFIYERENEIADLKNENHKIIKENFIEKLIEIKQSSNKLDFFFNEETKKIEIFLNEEKIIDLENSKPIDNYFKESFIDISQNKDLEINQNENNDSLNNIEEAPESLPVKSAISHSFSLTRGKLSLDACEFRQENINLNELSFSNLDKEGLEKGLENHININAQSFINKHELNNNVENYLYLNESPRTDFNENHNIENNFTDGFSNYNIKKDRKINHEDQLNIKISESKFVEVHNSPEKKNNGFLNNNNNEIISSLNKIDYLPICKYSTPKANDKNIANNIYRKENQHYFNQDFLNDTKSPFFFNPKECTNSNPTQNNIIQQFDIQNKKCNDIATINEFKHLKNGKSSSYFKRIDKNIKSVSFGKINSNDIKNIFDLLSLDIKKDSNKKNSEENPKRYKLKDSNFSIPKFKNEKIKKLRNFKSNFKHRFTTVHNQKVTPDGLFFNVKNKLFYSDQLQKLALENINLDGNSENNRSFNNYTDNVLDKKNNQEKKNEKNLVQIDYPLFKSTNSSMLNDSSFNSNIIRRTTINNYNYISNKLSSIAVNSNLNEIFNLNLKTEENENTHQLYFQNDSHSNNNSFALANNNKSKILNSNDKRFILKDLIDEEDFLQFEINNNSCKADKNEIHVNTLNTVDMEIENFCNEKNFIQKIKDTEIDEMNAMIYEMNDFDKLCSFGFKESDNKENYKRKNMIKIEHTVNISIFGNNIKNNKESNNNYNINNNNDIKVGNISEFKIDNYNEIKAENQNFIIEKNRSENNLVKINYTFINNNYDKNFNLNNKGNKSKDKKIKRKNLFKKKSNFQNYKTSINHEDSLISENDNISCVSNKDEYNCNKELKDKMLILKEKEFENILKNNINSDLINQEDIDEFNNSKSDFKLLNLSNIEYSKKKFNSFYLENQNFIKTEENDDFSNDKNNTKNRRKIQDFKYSSKTAHSKSNFISIYNTYSPSLRKKTVKTYFYPFKRFTEREIFEYISFIPSSNIVRIFNTLYYCFNIFS